MSEHQQQQRNLLSPSPVAPLEAEIVRLRRSDRALFARVRELHQRLDQLERVHTEGVQLNTNGTEDEDDTLAHQATVIRVWCPAKTHGGRSYGMLLHGRVVGVIEGEAATAKLSACTNAQGDLDAKTFWGSVARRIDRMPPAAGTWDWRGTAKYSSRHYQWTLTGGEWSRPNYEEV